MKSLYNGIYTLMLPETKALINLNLESKIFDVLLIIFKSKHFNEITYFLYNFRHIFKDINIVF